MSEAAAVTPSPRADEWSTIHAADLARLMPMHLVLDPTARIIATGPTLEHVFPSGALLGESLFDIFDLRGPLRIADAAGLRALAGLALRVTLREGAPGARVATADGMFRANGSGGAAPRLRMRGLAVLLGGGGFLLNLSFGVDIVPAVGLLRLDGSDFAPTDMAPELLYLAEANAAVMTEIRRLLGRLERARLQAEDEARTDALTGLRNRRALDSLLARLCREGAGFALLSLDLDGFKAVNDSHGHAAGDRVLAEVAERLRARAASRDFVARIGGDEFAMLLPGPPGPGRLRVIGEGLIAALSSPIVIEGVQFIVSASVGIAVAPAGAVTEPAEVMARADAGVYAAKRGGRGRVVLVPASSVTPLVQTPDPAMGAAAVSSVNGRSGRP